MVMVVVVVVVVVVEVVEVLVVVMMEMVVVVIVLVVSLCLFVTLLKLNILLVTKFPIIKCRLIGILLMLSFFLSHSLLISPINLDQIILSLTLTWRCQGNYI